MAFCSFSKDTDNTYTIVENKFITKYLPEADGFAVKVYLYGLYLCKNSEIEFTIASMAEVLKTTEENVKDAFLLWKDYDLVEILSDNPFSVQYLPVQNALGKPKKTRYERYADFNMELQRKMQKVGKFISANDYVKYMRFLEESNMQPQALLLIAEFCIQKQGEAVSPSYIFNKANKLLRNGCSTYAQVEKELSNYNANEGKLIAIFNAMSTYQRTPDDSDYALYKKWTEDLGFSQSAILTAARKQKRGTMTSLDMALDDLSEKGKLESKEIETYLTEREDLAKLTFRIGRKLGAKVQNPMSFVDLYVEKWYYYGFEENSLLDIALFCLKTERGDFDSMHTLVEKLFADGVVSKDGVKAFLKEKNEELKLFSKIQEICGSIRKNATNLSLIKTWRDWNFNDEMILEAANRSAGSVNPIPYINKILSEWKQTGVFQKENIPENGGNVKTPIRSGYTNPSIEAANAKSDRERYYALLREKAVSRAEKLLAKANGNARFKEIAKALSQMELSLAKAEIFEPAKLPVLTKEKKDRLCERKEILNGLGLTEEDLTPKYGCAKCSDTGFLPDGTACDCYRP